MDVHSVESDFDLSSTSEIEKITVKVEPESLFQNIEREKIQSGSLLKNIDSEQIESGSLIKDTETVMKVAECPLQTVKIKTENLETEVESVKDFEFVNIEQDTVKHEGEHKFSPKIIKTENQTTDNYGINNDPTAISHHDKMMNLGIYMKEEILPSETIDIVDEQHAPSVLKCEEVDSTNYNIVERQNSNNKFVEYIDLPENDIPSTSENNKQKISKLESKRNCKKTLLFQDKDEKESKKFQMKSSVDTVNKRYDCQECDKSFPYMCRLKIHINEVHRGIKNRFPCEECSRAFPKLGNLQRHVDAVHKKIKSYQCQLCDKMFAQLFHLQQHVNVMHEGIRNHVCEICDKKFSQIAFLRHHVNVIHKGIRDYQCDKCDKRFSLSTRLKSHIQAVHEGIDHACPDCGKKFSRLPNLRRHIDTIHKKIKNFSCEECDKRFSEFHHLTNHVNIVHKGIRKFPCNFCTRTFTSLHHLKTHFGKEHKDIGYFDFSEYNNL